ncbi:short-chain dehydrogenase [Stemphylium lycopersici]|nr:short-chain dehydrogenase [Stemphylium lycopersici]
MPKSVLITGCSTGIGLSLAQAFQNKALLSSQLPASHPLSTRYPPSETRLDCLIHNAGIGIDLPALDTLMDEAKRLFETNFWGTVRMC